MRQPSPRRGNTLIEFTLVGIPLIFVLISTFEIARGMWLYETLAHAVREGVRFAAVHGNNCTIYPNNCITTVQDIARRIERAGVGLLPEEVRNVVMATPTRQIRCATLAQCLQDTTFFPALPRGAPGYPDTGSQQGSWIEIRAEYPFRSAIAMFWPGAGPGMVFGTHVLSASSRERIQY
jgi:hypothetical protein